MDHICHSPVFSSVTRLLALLESTAEAPHRQVTKWANRLASFSARLPRYWLKQLHWFKHEEAVFLLRYCTHTIAFSNKSNCLAVILKRSRQALAAMRRSSAFRSAKRWLRLHRKRSLEHELFCYNAWSALYDGPKVSCYSYVIIVRTLIQLLDTIDHTNRRDVH